MNGLKDQQLSGLNRRGFLAASAVAVGFLKDATAAGLPGPYPSEAVTNANEGQSMRFDVVVVGGGPAGLSAALVLGRACLQVMLCDAGPGRNAPAAGVHGFLGQDGTPPADLRRLGLDQLKPYDVTHRTSRVVEARRSAAGFTILLEGGDRVECRKLILATGVEDVLPEIAGLRERWGGGVIHCPYCHGWETRGRPWAFLVPEEAITEIAPMLLGWTRTLTFLTNGAAVDKPEHRDWLARHRIEVIEDPIDRLEGDGQHLDAIQFKGGRRLEVPTLFLGVRNRQRSPLAEGLGCKLVADGRLAGSIQTDAFGTTGVDGLYVVGDASSAGVPSVASAVAEGALAAAMASRALFNEAAA